WIREAGRYVRSSPTTVTPPPLIQLSALLIPDIAKKHMTRTCLRGQPSAKSISHLRAIRQLDSQQLATISCFTGLETYGTEHGKV
ncbi:hypothetical protein, partial [Pseudomonas ficuserectae]|uniref:hypothetical protein n=1 Tax=Pseudomonas ficuserectae TaxID=53410 RepID=UPI001C3F2485